MKNGMKKAVTCIALAVLLGVTCLTPAKAATTTKRYVPTKEDIKLTKDIVHLDTNGYYSAALMKNGDLYTWGTMAVKTSDTSYELTTDEKKYKDPALFARNVKKVQLGDCVYGYIDDQDDLYMWGANISGMIGDKENKMNYTKPVKVLDNVKDFKVSGLGGGNRVAAITNDGELYMWGDNYSNVIGNKDNDPSFTDVVYTPHKISLPGKVAKVAVDSWVSGVVLENKEAYLWGDLNNKELENFNAQTANRGDLVKVAEQVEDLQLNRNLRSYLTTDGDLYTWGNNGYKELGREIKEEEDYYKPGKINELSDVASYRLNATSFALKKDGTLYAWGDNEQGAVGNGEYTTYVNRYVVLPVKVLDEVKMLPSPNGDYNSVSSAIKKDNSLWVWGSNNSVSLGIGDKEDKCVTPVKVMDSVTNAVVMDGIGLATCTDGSMWGWGWNDRKAIGDFTVEKRSYPIVITLYGPSPSVNGNNTGGTEKKVQKITVSGISKKIAAGKSVSLRATVKPSNASNKKVSWKSSNTKYATVSRSGKVTVKKAGAGKKVTITASAIDGSKVKGSYTIQIKKHAVSKISLKIKSTSLKAGKSAQIKAIVKVTGKDANKVLNWKSSNTKYATVSSKGKVVAKKAGKGKRVKISAYATDGSGKKATVTIKIK